MSSRPTARSSIGAPADVSEGRAGPAARSAAEIAAELSAWAVGGGIITAAVFPLALPILALVCRRSPADTCRRAQPPTDTASA